MREIKFRVWDKDLKKMHICGENQHDSISFTYPENEAYYYNLQNGCGSSSDGSGTYELMQYTNLKDKNGNEINEKDIVDINGQKLIVHLGKHAYDTRDLLVGGLYREVYGFYLESPCGSWEVNIAVVLDDLEVIGNIYENPELLGGVSE